MLVRPLTIEDKNFLASKLLKIGDYISEYSFSNLFLFRKRHNYNLYIEDNLIFLEGKSYDNILYYMPLFNLSDEKLFSMFLKAIPASAIIFPISQDGLQFFEQSKFDFSFHEGDQDYIYRREKLEAFPGKKLHSKRNLLKQFLASYSARVEKIDSDEKRASAIGVLKSWQIEFEKAHTDESDFAPCLEALNLQSELNLEGFLFYADEEAVGFTLGEKINEEVFGLHFAKANKNIKGVYQYMFSQTASLISSNYKYINLEQDLGSLPLRATKSSYQPDIIGTKYRIKLK